MDNDDSTFVSLDVPLSPLLRRIRDRMDAVKAQQALEDADLALELRRETGDIRYAMHANYFFDTYEHFAERRQLGK